MKDTTLLVEKTRKGDRRAFNELYRLYYLSLRSYARLFITEKEAEDVVQDVFLNIWIHRERLNNNLSFQGYLLRSVYNTSLNIIKQKYHSETYRSTQKDEIEIMGYRHYDPDENEIIRQLYNQDLKADIQQAIDSLPDRCREVFSLSYLEDMSSKEISTQLGISLSTVENHIYAALKQLRKRLKSIHILLFVIVLLICK